MNCDFATSNKGIGVFGNSIGGRKGAIVLGMGRNGMQIRQEGPQPGPSCITHGIIVGWMLGLSEALTRFRSLDTGLHCVMYGSSRADRLG
jgi:hypothetical protein